MSMQAPLPAYLSNEILKNLFFNQNYVCCEFDHQNRILQYWGDPNCLGLTSWTIDTDLESLGFMQGMPMYDSWTLNDVQVAEGHYADIYFSPTVRGKKYLLLVPKTLDVERLKKYQQFHHEHQIDHGKDEAEFFSISTKSQLLKKISKQINAPLASIFGSTHLLSIQENQSERSTKQIEIINRATNEIMTTLANARDYIYFANNSFELFVNTVSLDSMVNHIVSTFAPIAANRGVTFGFSVTDQCPENIRLDNLRFSRIIINVLNYVLDFIDSQSEITMLVDVNDSILMTKISFTAQVNKVIGETIAENEQAMSIELSKKVIDAMGGEFEFNFADSITEGLIYIPYESVEENGTIDTNKKITVNSPMNKMVLLVGQDQIRNGRYKSYLNVMGYQVTEVGNAQLALAFLEEIPFDLIVTELNPLKMTRHEMIEDIRSAGYELPIIAITSKEGDNTQDVKARGASSVLVQPIKFTHLSREIEKHIKMS